MDMYNIPFSGGSDTAGCMVPGCGSGAITDLSGFDCC